MLLHSLPGLSIVCILYLHSQVRWGVIILMELALSHCKFVKYTLQRRHVLRTIVWCIGPVLPAVLNQCGKPSRLMYNLQKRIHGIKACCC